MKIRLLLPLILFCTITYSQTNEELKNFINKNHVAIRTVQKNMMHENKSSYVPAFKGILKNQKRALNQFGTDNAASFHFALLVRNECLSFLNQHTKGSTDYFQLTESETFAIKAATPSHSESLNNKESQEIDQLDVLNIQALNSLNLTIQ